MQEARLSGEQQEQRQVSLPYPVPLVFPDRCREKKPTPATAKLDSHAATLHSPSWAGIETVAEGGTMTGRWAQGVENGREVEGVCHRVQRDTKRVGVYSYPIPPPEGYFLTKSTPL